MEAITFWVRSDDMVPKYLRTGGSEEDVVERYTYQLEW